MIGEKLSAEELTVLDERLSNGEVIFTHAGAEYAYLGAPGDNDGCLSVEISRERLLELGIPITNL